MVNPGTNRGGSGVVNTHMLELGFGPVSRSTTDLRPLPVYTQQVVVDAATTPTSWSSSGSSFPSLLLFLLLGLLLLRLHLCLLFPPPLLLPSFFLQPASSPPCFLGVVRPPPTDRHRLPRLGPRRAVGVTFPTLPQGV